MNKKSLLVTTTFLLISAFSLTGAYGAEKTFTETDAWIRYILTVPLKKQGPALMFRTGSRYNFHRSLKIDGTDQSTNKKKAWQQELSGGIMVPLYKYWNISFKGIFAYTPFFFFADEHAKPFYVHHTLELHLRMTVQFDNAWLWYRIHTSDWLPGEDGGGNNIKNSIIQRHQVGLAWPVFSWLVPMLDNEVFLRLTPDKSKGEKVFYQNVTTATFRFKVAPKVALDLRYGFAWILKSETAANAMKIQRHSLCLWVRHKV